MAAFRVSRQVDVDAPHPLLAAAEAHRLLLDGGGLTFDIVDLDDGSSHSITLDPSQEQAPS